MLKRVIGLPEDSIRIENGEVYRNGELLVENYLDQFNKNNTQVAEGSKTYLVPDNKYFILGDNRIGSVDSRSITKEWSDPNTNEHVSYVPKKNIIGKSVFILKNKKKLSTFFTNE